MSFILASGAAEETISMHLSQVEQQNVQLCLWRLNLSFKLIEWKLDLFLSIEDFLDQALTQLCVSWDVIDGHLGRDFGRLDRLVVLDWAEFEVFGLAI